MRGRFTTSMHARADRRTRVTDIILAGSAVRYNRIVKLPKSSKLRERAFRQGQGAKKASSVTPEKSSKWPARKYLREYARWLWPYRWALAAVLLLALISAALDMVWPLAIKVVIDGLTSAGGFAVNAKVIFRLRKRLFRRLIGLPLVELSEMKTGGITSRLSGDVDSVSGLVQMALISPTVAIIRVVLTIAIFFALSWKLAVAALI